MTGKRSSKSSRRKSKNRRFANSKGFYRHPCIEPLESRQLLSVTLPVISDQTVLAGAPLNLALDTTNTTTNALTYTVSVSNANLSNSNVANPQLTAAIPQGNPSLKITVDDAADGIHGDIVLQLFQDLAPNTVDKIMSLVNSDTNFYNGLIFHRVIDGFMIQGGSGGTVANFDDEFNAALQFTGPGLLAMANSHSGNNGGYDTNGSQFFITVEPTRWLDYIHTIFGMVTEGYDIVQQIEAVPVDSSTYKPTNNVVMTDVSIISDNQNGVLRLSAPDGTTGTADVTVTVTDSVTNESTSQTFHVTVGADTTNDPPFLRTIDPIQTTVNTPVTMYIPATDVENNAIYYNGGIPTTNANLNLQVDNSTGEVLITPSNGITGVYSVLLGVAASSSATYDIQAVPLYISPAAPSGISLLTASDTGSNTADRITSLNNASGNTLQFQVSGVVSGTLVELFADGLSIGQATASSTSVVITTNGTTTLSDGAHSFTAKQTLKNQTVDVGNLNTTVDLASTLSSSLSVTVDTTQPQFTSTPLATIKAEQFYSYQAAATDSTGAVTYALSNPPTGMTINSATGLITWTPTNDQQPTQHVVVQATDLAGNISAQTFDVTVLPVNHAPVLTAIAPVMGSTNENMTITINLTGTFINNGAATTTIIDADTQDAVGGIAIIDLSGNGTWQYSTDGTTFQNVGTVSPTSALLLANTAKLRYIPDGQNGETPIISFRAWDATVGTNGEKADTTTNGGNTVFSVNTDIATITVTDINNAPVLTSGNPSLGNITTSAIATINLTGTFINNGTGTSGIADVDNNATVGGIAVVDVTGNGIWEYSADGETFSALGTVSDASALLLAGNAVLRYTPNGTASETATITYRAWDATSGQSGETADTTANGDDTAFSTATDTASLTVNDAPVLASASPDLGSTDENTEIIIGTFINNDTGTTIITDVNDNAVVGGIALVGVTGNGTWQYSTDGANFTDVGTVAGNSALLLSSDATLKYIPDGNNGETAAITYRAWDTTSGQQGDKADATANGGATAFSADTDTASLTVTDVNDAPVLTSVGPSLGDISLNTATTISLTGTFINNGSNTTTIADVDHDAVVGGIALVDATGNGTWEYSTDGANFTAVGSVSDASALLLSKVSVLRYTTGSVIDATPPVISYRAWDATSGQNGDRADTTTTAGATAFSTATDTASFTLATGSISGYVYIDTNNDGARFTSSGKTHLAIPGVVIQLLAQDGQGNWVEVSGKSPVMTNANGSYSFDGLVSGTYRVKEVQPTCYLDGIDTPGTIDGTGTASAGNDYFDIVLGAGANAAEYNFGERGLIPSMISMRFLLASSPPVAQLIAQLNAVPEVVLSASAASNNYIATYQSGGSSVAVAAADAKITDSDSTMLAWMKATIANPLDGNTEKLEAVVTNTPITATYSNNVLSLSGVAGFDVYRHVLMSITYANTAQSPREDDRSIEIVVNDGISDSVPVTATVKYEPATQQSAVDAVLQLNGDWLSGE